MYVCLSHPKIPIVKFACFGHNISALSFESLSGISVTNALLCWTLLLKFELVEHTHFPACLLSVTFL